MTNRYANQQQEAILIAIGRSKARQIPDGLSFQEVKTVLTSEQRSICDLLLSDTRETVKLTEYDGVIRNPEPSPYLKDFEHQVELDPFTASMFTLLSREVGVELTCQVFDKMFGRMIPCCECGERFLTRSDEGLYYERCQSCEEECGKADRLF